MDNNEKFVVTIAHHRPKLKGVKSHYTMRKTNSYGSDLFLREEETSGYIRWWIENKGMYDEQSPANAASLEKTFQEHLSNL